MIRVCYREEIISLGDSNVQTMCSLLSMKPGEYSYFSPRTMKMWAGPDHWRFRPRPKREYLWWDLKTMLSSTYCLPVCSQQGEEMLLVSVLCVS